MSFNSENLLDTITTTDGVYHGVIDYSNKKHVTFYDLSNNNCPDIILLVMSWRMSTQNLRFSIFKAMYYPETDIGVILIPRRSIVSSSVNIETTSIKHERMRITKGLYFSQNDDS
jgi:hypothetical protein